MFHSVQLIAPIAMVGICNVHIGGLKPEEARRCHGRDPDNSLETYKSLTSWCLDFSPSG